MSKRKKSDQVFKGELAEPIKGDWRRGARWGLMDTRSDEQIEKDRQSESRRISVATMEKLFALARHYDIDDEDYTAWATKMMFRLADEFVPGFKVSWGDEPKVGAKKKWNGSRYSELVADVALLQMENPHRSDSDAVRLLMKEERFGDRWGKAKNEASLRNRLIEGRKRAHNPLVGALLEGPMGGKGPGYDEMILNLLVEHFSINAAP